MIADPPGASSREVPREPLRAGRHAPRPDVESCVFSRDLTAGMAAATASSMTTSVRSPLALVPLLALFVLPWGSAACSAAAPGDGAAPADGTDDSGVGDQGDDGAAATADDASSVDFDASTDAHDDAHSGSHADAGSPHDAGSDAPSCAKHVTALFTVGTGAGSLASHATSGCWDVIDADGAVNKSWRKCSTNNYMVVNPSAPNWSFDDSAPTHPLSQDQSFISQCSAGSTGMGFEYLAYRNGSWRLLFPYPSLKAFVAELHASDFDVDDNWPSAYVGNAQLAKHTVYPMFNIGPRNDPSPSTTLSKIKNDGLAICKTIKSGGYFGIYVGTWDQPMPNNDPRILALATALDDCTK